LGRNGAVQILGSSFAVSLANAGQECTIRLELGK
jgi:hypothetical protein